MVRSDDLLERQCQFVLAPYAVVANLGEDGGGEVGPTLRAKPSSLRYAGLEAPSPVVPPSAEAVQPI